MLKADLNAIQAEIAEAGHGGRRAVVARYAGLFGVSDRTIYRELARKFGRQKTLSRKKVVDDNDVLMRLVAEMKVRSMRLGLGERELSTENCIKTLVDSGIEGAEDLTMSTVNRRLRDKGFRIPQPRVLVEAEFANQEHQLDFSRSKYFQLVKYLEDRDDYLIKISGRELHYKQEDRRLRTWMVQVKDSFSRVRLARLFAATGESGLLGLEMLNWCWIRPEDANPMRFVPAILKTDNGSFHKRLEVKEVMRALKVDFRASAPYNSASQGKVESGFRSLWQSFELPLATKMGDGATLYLSEYNELLHEWLIADDAQKQHPRASDTREAMYRKSILAHAPRFVSDDVLRIACRVEKRKVNETLEIRLDGDIYQAPVYAAKKWVMIHKNMSGELIGELVGEDRRPFILKPYEFARLDDFSHRPHATYRQQVETEVDRLDASTSLSTGSKRLFMQPKPEEIAADSKFADAGGETEFANVYAAKVYIGEQLRGLGSTYADYADVFDEMLEKDLSKETIDTVLAEVKKFSVAM